MNERMNSAFQRGGMRVCLSVGGSVCVMHALKSHVVACLFADLAPAKLARHSGASTRPAVGLLSSTHAMTPPSRKLRPALQHLTA